MRILTYHSKHKRMTQNFAVHCLFKRSVILECIFRRYLLTLSNASTVTLQKWRCISSLCNTHLNDWQININISNWMYLSYTANVNTFCAHYNSADSVLQIPCDKPTL
jgi:hypothetical protein